MPSVWLPEAIVVATVLVAILVRSLSRRFDGVLLIISGLASLVLAFFASSAMQTVDGAMTFEMSRNSFGAGVVSPVAIVATLTLMRGLFKFFGE